MIFWYITFVDQLSFVQFCWIILLQYLRLADDTKTDVVIRLLRDYWKMFDPKKPSLVITVIGGAKNFKLDGKKRVIFNKGLINVGNWLSYSYVNDLVSLKLKDKLFPVIWPAVVWHWSFAWVITLNKWIVYFLKV